jgi:hypothetical protein
MMLLVDLMHFASHTHWVLSKQLNSYHVNKFGVQSCFVVSSLRNTITQFLSCVANSFVYGDFFANFKLFQLIKIEDPKGYISKCSIRFVIFLQKKIFGLFFF